MVGPDRQPSQRLLIVLLAAALLVSTSYERVGAKEEDDEEVGEAVEGAEELDGKELGASRGAGGLLKGLVFDKCSISL